MTPPLTPTPPHLPTHTPHPTLALHSHLHLDQPRSANLLWFACRPTPPLPLVLGVSCIHSAFSVSINVSGSICNKRTSNRRSSHDGQGDDAIASAPAGVSADAGRSCRGGRKCSWFGERMSACRNSKAGRKSIGARTSGCGNSEGERKSGSFDEWTSGYDKERRNSCDAEQQNCDEPLGSSCRSTRKGSIFRPWQRRRLGISRDSEGKSTSGFIFSSKRSQRSERIQPAEEDGDPEVR